MEKVNCSGVATDPRAYQDLASAIGGDRPPDQRQPDGFTEKDALTAIETIHRHASGVLTFHRKNDGVFENVSAIRSEHMRRLFWLGNPRLSSDSFMSVNAFWDPAVGPHLLSAVRSRKREGLRYLCACFADIDCYKIGCSSNDAIDMTLDLQGRGMIPNVSVLVKSGRGIWLLWLLHDVEDPKTAPRAWREKLGQYIQIQTKINEKFAHLGADARDPLRLIRIPGSLHSIANTRVSYLFHTNALGDQYTYTLDELSSGFAVLERAKPSLPPSRASHSSRNLGSRGPKALTEYRMADFLTLLELRGGGFDKGCRNRAAMYYAWLLKCQRVHMDEAINRVVSLGKKCRPPLSRSECVSAVNSGYNLKSTNYTDSSHRAPPSIKYQTVSNWLGITAVEANDLIKYPPADRFTNATLANVEHKSRRIAQVERRTEIRRIAAEEGCAPSLRAMAKLLRIAGYPASHVTVRKDYRALGLRPHQEILEIARIHGDAAC
jgi:hypothetical protein